MHLCIMRDRFRGGTSRREEEAIEDRVEGEGNDFDDLRTQNTAFGDEFESQPGSQTFEQVFL